MHHIIFQPGFICLGMAPVMDGPGGFLPQMPYDLRAAGEHITGPIISGINQEDGSVFAPLGIMKGGGGVTHTCPNIYLLYIESYHYTFSHASDIHT